MDVFYFAIGIIITGLVMTGIFTLGALFALRITTDAHDAEQYDKLREEYYRLAGYRNPGDPKPYVPSMADAKYTRRRMLPGMNALDRMIKQGRRGTLLWRAGDR